jgi:hypothetical protein
MFTEGRILIALGALVWLTASAADAAEEGRRRAILVGVNRYDSDKLRPLRYSVNDVTALAPILSRAGYKVELLTDLEADRVAERRPTLKNIRSRLKVAIGQSRRKDTLLIGLTGHGLQFNGDRDSYFCPSDADPANRSSLLSLGGLFRDLGACAGTKLVLMDACRDDPGVSRGVDASAAAALQLPDDVAALFSCAAGERALESDRYQHGVFFYHVLQGLHGAAANVDGEVTWLSLTDYVKKRVPLDVARLHGGRVTQTPSLRAGELTAASPILARKPGSARLGRLAVTLRPIGLRRALERKQHPTQPEVVFIIPGGGGDRLGLKPGDILLQVDGFDVKTDVEALAAMRNRVTGARIELTVDRAGKTLTLSGRYETLLPDEQLISRIQQLAESGDVEAQAQLGESLAHGRLTVKDEAEAVTWLRRAAEQGHSPSQTSLGSMYKHGRGVAQDYEQAVTWFRNAADQEDAGGQLFLGIMYERGWGVAQDHGQAVAWFRKSAEQGSPLGQNNLGVMYEQGRGVAQDYAQAVAWYRKAAEQGNALGQRNLGVMYDNGRGVARDHGQAVTWYRKAAQNGNQKAVEDLRRHGISL